MSSATARLLAVAREVTAEGSDPDHLVRVVAWSLRRGHQPDGLRRHVRDLRDGATPLLAQGDASEPTAAEAIAQVAGDPRPSETDGVTEVLGVWRSAQVRVALVGDPGYPHRLAEGWPDVDAPGWLAVRGEPAVDAPMVALVGARRATGYGSGVAAWLAEAAADAGVRVVSGGAVGIDAAAHGAALGRPGGTTVVLGCGHTVAYPRPHAKPGGLFDRIVEDGGAIVSESLPTAPPRAHRIRARNRIVAALAEVVVVVEGGATSGSLLTATAALERDRTVLAVPGDVRAPGSTAPHRLLAEGAAPCTSPRDLLEVVGRSPTDPEASRSSQAAVPSSLPREVHHELAASWPRALRLEDLATRTGHPVGVLLASLTRAKVAGEVADGADGIRLRRAPAGAIVEGARNRDDGAVT